MFADGMDFPLLARMPDGTAREAAVRRPPPAGPGVVQPRSMTCGADCIGGRARCGTCGSRSERWRVSGDQAVGGTDRAGSPDRLADAGAEDDAAVAAGDDAVPAPGLRDLARRGHRRGSGPGHRRPGKPGRAGLARRHRDPGPGLPRQLAVPAGGTPVAGSRLQVDARSWTRSSQPTGRPRAGPHPRSAEWERTYGRVIPGDTCARQVGTVQRWYDGAQRDAWEVRTVAFGVDSAVGHRAGRRGQRRGRRLRGAADRLPDQFLDCRWPRLYLTADPLGDPPDQPD